MARQALAKLTPETPLPYGIYLEGKQTSNPWFMRTLSQGNKRSGPFPPAGTRTT